MNANNLKSMPRNVWVLGLASLLTDSSSEMIHSVLPLFLVSNLGASLMMVGLIEGLGESIASLTKLFSGVLSDYLQNRKLLVVCGYGLSTCVKPLFAFAVNPLMVLCARCGDRIGKGIRGAPRDALVADSVDPGQRGAAFGLRQALDTVGACIGPAVALALTIVSASNYRFVFWCALLPAVMAVLLLAVGVKEKKTANSGGRSTPLDTQALKNLGSRYWLLVWVALVFNLGNSSDAFLLLRIKQMGLPANWTPLALVVMNVTYSLSAYPFGALSDRIGRYGLLLTSMIAYAAIYAGFAAATAVWHLWILFALYGIYMGASQGVLLALVADTVPADQRGTAFGFINLATGITMFPASVVAGILWDRVSPSAAFSFGSVLALAAAILLAIGYKAKSSG